jgi:homocysteine S-methyltransferase
MPAEIQGPLTPLLRDGGTVILDGGLATELERRGADLADRLWSARLLADDPGLIAEVHQDYLAAGADVVATASYQASIGGFARRGLSESAARGLIRLSAALARDVRDRFWLSGGIEPGRPRPLVAGSIGPYGAALADGSEYRGRYQIGPAELMAFHLPRLEELVAGGVDVLALETFPSPDEAVIVLGLMRQWPGMTAWVSFSTADDAHVAEGQPVEEAVRAVAGLPGVVAVGVNCLPPSRVDRLLERIGRVTNLPLVAYPNLGETWDAVGRCWVGTGEEFDPARDAGRWHRLGARLLGGCCRTTPGTVRAIRHALSPVAPDTGRP